MKKSIIPLCLLLVFFIGTSHAQQMVEAEKILEKSEWMDIYQTFEVPGKSLAKIKEKLADDLRIDVDFAFWCGDSEVNVPKFMRIIDLLNNKKLKVNYFVSKRKANGQVKYYVEKFKVERIPTFIFYKGDKEIGRIIENPQEDMIQDFLKALH